MSLSVDILPTQKSHIDLSDRLLPQDFDLKDFVFKKLLDDVILVEFIDLVGDEGEYAERNGILISTTEVQNMWRKGKVILKGPNANYVEVGDIVVFPNNMGIPIKNLEVWEHGPLKNGLFLNEQRIFGVCERLEKNEEDRKD